MKTTDSPVALVDQQQALDAYFDALFNSEAAVQNDAVAAVPQDIEAPAEAVPVAVTQEEPDQSDAVQEETPALAGLQVQVFKVAGLTLAVPLERLKSMLTNQDGLIANPAEGGLVVGTVTCDGKPARVVDTARLLLPQERTGKLIPDQAARSRHVLVLDGGDWALACSHVEEVAGLAETEITWRTAAGKRPWLAGMVTQRRCALLDVDGLLKLLEDRMA